VNQLVLEMILERVNIGLEHCELKLINR
jgi:hypothetical protein